MREDASAPPPVGQRPDVPVGPRLSDVRTSDHGTGGLSLLSNEITKLSQCRRGRASLRATSRSGARRRRRRRAAVCPPRRARRPRRVPRRRRRVRAPGAEHERDLALRRGRRTGGELGARCRGRPPRTASSARGRRPPRAPASKAASERSDAPSRCGDSNATTGPAQSASSRQSASSSPALRGRKPTNA